jgi:hypothetical protein
LTAAIGRVMATALLRKGDMGGRLGQRVASQVRKSAGSIAVDRQVGSVTLADVAGAKVTVTRVHQAFAFSGLYWMWSGRN